MPDVATVLALAAQGCPTPQPPLSPEPIPQEPSSSTPSAPGAPLNLGDSGAAALPALEDARHFAFMSIVGRR